MYHCIFADYNGCGEAAISAYTEHREKAQGIKADTKNYAGHKCPGINVPLHFC